MKEIIEKKIKELISFIEHSRNSKWAKDKSEKSNRLAWMSQLQILREIIKEDAILGVKE